MRQADDTVLPPAIIDAHQQFWTGGGAYGFAHDLPGDDPADAAPPQSRTSVVCTYNAFNDRTLPPGPELMFEARFAANVADQSGDCGLVFNPIDAEDRSQTR